MPLNMRESRIVLVYLNNFPTFGIFSVTMMNGTIDRIIYSDSGQSCPGSDQTNSNGAKLLKWVVKKSICFDTLTAGYYRKKFYQRFFWLGKQADWRIIFLLTIQSKPSKTNAMRGITSIRPIHEGLKDVEESSRFSEKGSGARFIPLHQYSTWENFCCPAEHSYPVSIGFYTRIWLDHLDSTLTTSG